MVSKAGAEKERLDTALNNMSQGLIMFDAAERVVVCNDFYIEMYGMSREIVKPGCSFSDLLKYREESGNLLHRDFGASIVRNCGGNGVGQGRDFNLRDVGRA